MRRSSRPTQPQIYFLYSDRLGRIALGLGADLVVEQPLAPHKLCDQCSIDRRKAAQAERRRPQSANPGLLLFATPLA